VFNPPDVTLARAIHVIAVIFWIGGVATFRLIIKVLSARLPDGSGVS
jgi:uncharacterized membrane protein